MNTALADRKLTNSLQHTYHTLAIIMAAGCLVEEAAARVGLDEELVKTYIRDPRFQVILQEKRDLIDQTVANRIASSFDRAAAVFQMNIEKYARNIDSLADTAFNETTRLKANMIGIGFALKGLGDDGESAHPALPTPSPQVIEANDAVMNEIRKAKGGENSEDDDG